MFPEWLQELFRIFANVHIKDVVERNKLQNVDEIDTLVDVLASAIGEVVPRYWTQTNPPYEVDFLIQRGNDIFPVEVKSEANTASKSLKKFKELFPDQVKLRVRF